MGNTEWNAATDLDGDAFISSVPEFSENVREYNFYQLVELLQSINDLDPESEEWERKCKLVFSANPSLGFSASDVNKLTTREDNRHVLLTNFFGLSGAQSPLPGFILEQLASEGSDGFKQPFLDFFNNRLINLVYRIWRKYRYYVRFQPDAQDLFSVQLFALVGLSDQDLRGETPINWCKMLAYSGTLASRGRSPQIVAGIIAHCFELEDVSIRQWVRRRVPIDISQQFSLGGQNSTLGHDTVIGTSVVDCTGKFTICINGLTRARFNDFLPSGKEYQALCKLVEFIMREQMAYDLELAITPSEAPDFCLDSVNGVELGWTSFLGCSEADKHVLIQVRQ
ncbi:type VI secretion system baseplate subunit TssG [Vibrio fluminensis]|uniref:type VI secretion system baseplate subunit TssG n=1 Tax=Vibrio fluminensis TaxID=2783614 RepID=UPI0018898524|nr:type VI secretion system baseplate subunit TssG [Vibrio fluminensis]